MDSIIKEGSEKANERAIKTLSEVYDIIGFIKNAIFLICSVVTASTFKNSSLFFLDDQKNKVLFENFYLFPLLRWVLARMGSKSF